MNDKHMEATIMGLLETVRPALTPELETKAVAAIARAGHGRPAHAAGRVRWAVRIAIVGAAAALALGVFVVPGRWGSGRADSVLRNVGYAMARADSVLLMFRNTEEGVQWYARHRKPLPGGHRIALLETPRQNDMYLSSKAWCERIVLPDGTVRFWQTVDMDAGQWRIYSPVPLSENHGSAQSAFAPDQSTVYVADLAPLRAEAAAFLRDGVTFFFESGSWAQLFGKESILEKTTTVSSEQREGRAFTVLTFTGLDPRSASRMKHGPLAFPGEVHVRNVFVVDSQTNHLLSLEQYRRFENEAEVLVAKMARIEYNHPAPADLLALPPAATSVPATAELVQGSDNGTPLTALTMKVEGQDIRHIAVPKDWKK